MMDPQRFAHPDPQLGPALVPAPQPAASPATAPAAAPRPARVLPFPAPAGPGLASNAAGTQRRAYLMAEFGLLYVAGPVAACLGITRGLNVLELLWLLGGFCLTLLLTDPTFDRSQLWNAGPLRRQLPQILALFAAGMLAITALVHAYAPRLLFGLPRHHPFLWALILISYPVVSVLPQTIVYRVFLFHRYRPLLRLEPNRQAAVLIAISGVAFCVSHIVFRNWVAPALTLPGGLLFATRYHNTKSGCVSLVEHTLYGCFLFSVGLGHYFGMI